SSQKGDLVPRDKEGKLCSVRYKAVNTICSTVSQRAPDSGRAKERNCGAHCDRKRAGLANPEGQRRAPSEEIFTANRPQQSVRVPSPTKQPHLAIDRRGPKAAQTFYSLA